MRKNIFIVFLILLNGIVLAQNNCILQKEFVIGNLDGQVGLINESDYYEGRANYQVTGYPSSIAFDRENNLYITDTANTRINVYDDNYKFLRSINLDTFVESVQLKIYSNGFLILDESCNELSFKFFSFDGKQEWCIFNIDHIYFSIPDYFIYDEEDNILIAFEKDKFYFFYNLTNDYNTCCLEKDLNQCVSLLKSKQFTIKNGRLFQNNEEIFTDQLSQIGKNTDGTILIGKDVNGNYLYCRSNLRFLFSGKNGSVEKSGRIFIENGNFINWPAFNSQGELFTLVYSFDESKCALYKIDF